MVTHPDSKSNTDIKQISLSIENDIAIKGDFTILSSKRIKEMVEQFAYEANDLISFFQGITSLVSHSPLDQLLQLQDGVS